ncbi:MAG: hypothetical protein QF860_06725 [Planctomycetota bacterium]|nr:hypothetical protein [Planctomycetota bacterium]
MTSYTTNGDCWSEMVVLPGGEWSQACGGEDGSCKAKITRDDGVKNVTWNCGTGSAGGNVNAKTGYVISARNGC